MSIWYSSRIFFYTCIVYSFVPRCHYLQFPEGVLNRHYEKLVQCDPRFKALVDGTLSGSSPHYDSSDSAFEGQLVLRPKSRRPYSLECLRDTMINHTPLCLHTLPLSRYMGI